MEAPILSRKNGSTKFWIVVTARNSGSMFIYSHWNIMCVIWNGLTVLCLLHMQVYETTIRLVRFKSHNIILQFLWMFVSFLRRKEDSYIFQCAWIIVPRNVFIVYFVYSYNKQYFNVVPYFQFLCYFAIYINILAIFLMKITLYAGMQAGCLRLVISWNIGPISNCIDIDLPPRWYN